MSHQNDYPPYTFGWAVRSVFGDMVTFFLACILASAVAVVVHLGLSYCLSPAGLPLAITFWFTGVFHGGWGFLAYGILFVVFLLQASEEWPRRRTLACAFLVQSFETMRLLLTMSRGSWSLRITLFFCFWLAGFLVALIDLLAERCPRFPLGPLARLVGRGRHPADHSGSLE